MPALREHIAAASERYAAGFKYRGLASPPSNHFIFVTCMDARIDTSQAFGIGVGEAHVIRNVSSLYPRPTHTPLSNRGTAS